MLQGFIRRRADVFCRNVCDLRGFAPGRVTGIRPPPIEYKTSQSGPTLPLSVTWLRGSSFGRENPETPVSLAPILHIERDPASGL